MRAEIRAMEPRWLWFGFCGFSACPNGLCVKLGPWLSLSSPGSQPLDTNLIYKATDVCLDVVLLISCTPDLKAERLMYRTCLSLRPWAVCIPRPPLTQGSWSWCWGKSNSPPQPQGLPWQGIAASPYTEPFLPFAGQGRRSRWSMTPMRSGGG